MAKPAERVKTQGWGEGPSGQRQCLHPLELDFPYGKREGGGPLKRWFTIAALLLALLGAGFWLWPLSAIFLYRDAVLWSRGIESRTAEADGQHLHYLSQGTGRPIVILPYRLSPRGGAHDAPSVAARSQGETGLIPPRRAPKSSIGTNQSD